uniref:Secreted protein n=1 Tax=Achlya hypogyna TaxID=1202772 RepID=A0A0A7CP06_ACHHY|nr:secreted protein [Achlya hypogyna]
MLSFAKLITFFAGAVAAQTCSFSEQGAIKIGEKTPVSVTFNGAAPFSQIFQKDGATFAAPHFKSINVPANGKLTVTSLDGKQSAVYLGGEKVENVRAGWTSGKGVVVSYEASSYAAQDAPIFVLDEVSFGKRSPLSESLCGSDNSKPAPCYATSEPTKYKSGKSVARLLIGGESLCTGWLIGSEGHLITNNHCVGSADEAKDVQVELGAECKTCEDPKNQEQLACPGEIVATDATFVATSELADFTLIKLNIKAGVDIKKYGYLQVRPDGPKLGEEIHILGHAQGWPKRFAIVVDSGKPGVVTNTSIPSCQPDEFGYQLDTQGGNSGSPIIASKENVVVGIHNCGGCPDGDNGGIKINKVVDILKAANAVPKDAIAGDKPAC